MSLNAAILRKMQEKGLSLADAIELAELWEAGAAQPMPELSKGALRTRRWRENRQASRGDVTVTHHGDAERVSPEPPSENTPIPPLKGGTFPKIPASPEKPKRKPISVWVSEIWELAPRPGRERSGRRDLENALKAAEKRGADLAQVKAGVAGYYASPDATKNGGEFAKGVHVVVSSGRWEAFAEDDPEPASAAEADPWPGRLTRWRHAAYWNSEWGPKPGKPGYRGPPIEGLAA